LLALFKYFILSIQSTVKHSQISLPLETSPNGTYLAYPCPREYGALLAQEVQSLLAVRRPREFHTMLDNICEKVGCFESVGNGGDVRRQSELITIVMSRIGQIGPQTASACA
jgi:hypothetical protein